ncbi:MAG: ATP-binding protein [Caldilineaceae bacterium]|nr:ATP-binding protein [Caldilineaceae bacterium]MBP8110330.1 ATP-binding protein [Caldilineaceae bacterium]MBP8125620.1 ATP-binding protein [Caldilineaceae bacterium]MBP9074739.1 ATP-binding protein [Caldilineaceae bacterium]
MIPRLLEQRIEERLFRGRVITLFGARRVGKTTLVQKILENHKDKRTRYLNCDLRSVQQGLGVQEAEVLRYYLGDNDLVVLDEAQNIPDIGQILKILVDTYPELQIIATGSSSFRLANAVGEPLTGRVTSFELYPLSIQEIAGNQGFSVIEPRLQHLLRFGSFPDIVYADEAYARELLEELVSNYLFKDVLAFSGIKKETVLFDLVRMLALQLGNEVSYTGLANALQVDRKTIINYIDVLEQNFILFRLGAYSKNLRKEITKSQKIYFYDVGVRNALIEAFQPLVLRNDVGFLWENFCIVERLKYAKNNRRYINRYFWRTYDQKEIDYIEEEDGILSGYECKWSPDAKMKVPEKFLSAYPGTVVQRIDRSNYWRFLL